MPLLCIKMIWIKYELAPVYCLRTWLCVHTRFCVCVGGGGGEGGGMVCDGRFLFSRVLIFCAASNFSNCSTHVIAVVHKRSQSFCQKCRWQLRAKQLHPTCATPNKVTLWSGAWLYGVQHMVAVSRGHVMPKQHCKYTTLVDIQKNLQCKASHSLRVAWDRSAVGQLRSTTWFSLWSG